MESTLIYVLLALTALCLALCAYLALKMKTVLYLLEQPVVKKMSPQLKLKPVKIDELMAEKQRQQQQQQQQSHQPPQHRPPYQGSHGGQNGQRPQGGRGDRPDFDRNRDRDRDRNRDRGPRPERGEGDRERFRDRDRDRNRDRFGGNQRPPREGGEVREAPAAGETPRTEAPHHQPAPSQMNTHTAPLAPRRPLPSTVVDSAPVSHTPAPANAEAEGSMEGMFVGGDGDMQHGRRNQIKKKPRFDLDEEEVKTTEG